MGEFAQGGLITRSSTTVTSGGTLTLTVADVSWQVLTGSANHVVVLPNATTLKSGRLFQIANQSSGMVSVNFNSGTPAGFVAGPGVSDYELISNATTDGTWAVSQPADFNQPLKLSQTFPATARLAIYPNRVQTNDGAQLSTAILDDVFSLFPLSTVDFQTGATAGGVVHRDNQTFSLPASTTGLFKRVAFVYDSADNKVNATFSANAASVGALATPDSLFGALSGTQLGYIDIQGTATSNPGAFKSANASTNVILNAVAGNSTVARFITPSGVSADTSFQIQSVNTPIASIKGGIVLLADGREVATWDGVGTDTLNFGVSISLDLTAILGSSPANATTYYLYLNLGTLNTPSTIATGHFKGRVVYPVKSTDTAKFSLFTTASNITNIARYMPIGLITTATTGNVWSGAGAGFGSIAAKRYDNNPIAVNPVVFKLTGQTVGSIGSLGQIAAGQTLSTKSFASTVPVANIAWCNLRTDFSDGSGGGHPLAAVGVPTFTGLDLFGANLKSLVVSGASSANSLNAFYNAGAAVSVMSSIFVAMTTWQPGADQGIMSVGSAADFVWDITVRAGGNIEFASTATAGSFNNVITIPNPGFTASSWHRLGILFDATAGKFRAHIDGRVVGSVTQATLRAATTPNLRVGISTRGGNMVGRVEEFAYVKTTLSNDEDARKLYAFRQDHNKIVTSANQEWVANFYSHTATQDYSSWLVDKSDFNSVFWDLSGLAATNTADIIMRDVGMSPVVVPATAPFDAIYSANPTFPIPHGQMDAPTLLARQEVATNQWQPINLNGILSADSLNIYGTLASFTPSPSARVWLTAYTGSSPVAAKQADTVNIGLVKLQWGGYNKIVGTGFYSSLTAAGIVSGDCVLVTDGYTISAEEVISASNVTIVFFPGAVITVTGGSRALRLTGSNINVVRPRYLINFAGTLAAVVQLEANDCNVEQEFIQLNNAGLTVTAGIAILGTAVRSFVNGSIKTTLGVLSAQITDAGTDSDFSVRG